MGWLVRPRPNRGFGLPSGGGGSGLNYSTTFPLTESTISEGGNWENTVSATWSNPVSTSGGNAFGLGSTGVNDSVARLVGAYLRDQVATGVAFVNAPLTGAPEIEILLRVTMTPGSPDHIDCYEFDIIPTNGIYIVKWIGGQGNISVLNSAVIGTVVNGDVFECSAVGPAGSTVLTAKMNGATIVTYTDTSAYVVGNPGIGLDAGSPTDGAKLGWQSFSVVTS